MAQKEEDQILFGGYGSPSKAPDVTVNDQGTVVAFTLNTEAATDWVREEVLTEPWQWLGMSTFAVDHRYAELLIEAMRASGLEVG